MRGAIVFLVAFVIFLAVTFAYSDLPPGNMITDAVEIDPTVKWGGFAMKTLVSAILNGVIYGFLIWLIFTIVEKARK